MKNRAVIFDLDGTIANHTHRLNFVEDKKKDWDSFFNLIDKDLPVIPIVNLYHAIQLSSKYKMIIITGRPDKYRQETEQWLFKHTITYAELYMRNDKDSRADFIIKEEIFHKIKERYCIELVFDDRKDVVSMWRKNGLICLQVQDNA